MRSRIALRGCIRPSVCRSVCRSIGLSYTSWIYDEWAAFQQNSIKNIKLCHKKDIQGADYLNASEVWILSDFFVRIYPYTSRVCFSVCLSVRETFSSIASLQRLTARYFHHPLSPVFESILPSRSFFINPQFYWRPFKELAERHNSKGTLNECGRSRMGNN